MGSSWLETRGAGNIPQDSLTTENHPVSDAKSAEVEKP